MKNRQPKVGGGGPIREPLAKAFVEFALIFFNCFPERLVAIALVFISGCSTAPKSAQRPLLSDKSSTPYMNQTVSLSFDFIDFPKTLAVGDAPGASPEPVSGSAPDSALPEHHVYSNQTLFVYFVPASLAAVETIPSISWGEAKTLLAGGGFLLIDVRPPVEYRASHIPGAISIPAETPDTDLQIVMAPYPKNQPIIVYCASIGCPASRDFARRLASFGFLNVRDLPGGFVEYLNSFSPTANPQPP